MIYELCQIFHSDKIHIEENYTVLDYYTYTSFPQLQNAFEKNEMEKNNK